MESKEFNYKYSFVKIFSDQEKFFSCAQQEIKNQVDLLESHIKKNPSFKSSLESIEVNKDSPKIAQEMIGASNNFGIGPMSSVAGAVAYFAAAAMKKEGAKISMVENGGDIFIARLQKEISVKIFSGSKFKNLFFKIKPKDCSLAICSSSGTMGHSMSFGKADLACVISKSAFLADAGATFLGNLIKEEGDIEKSLELVLERQNILGALAIKGDKIGMVGDVGKFIK